MSTNISTNNMYTVNNTSFDNTVKNRGLVVGGSEAVKLKNKFIRERLS